MEKSELLKQLRIDRGAAPPPRARRWLVWLAGVAAVIAFAAGWLITEGHETTVRTVLVKPPVAVSASTSVLDATGYVVARRQSTVSAKITGKIEQILIEEGQHVENGQVLARLDATDARAQLGLTEAQLQAARAQLNDLEVQLRQSERDLKRQQDLVQRKLTSPQAVEQARVAVDSLKARLAAQNQQIAVADQALQVARVNLDNTVIRAPFSGVIVTKAAQPGEIVSPMSAGGGFTRTGIGTIVDMDSLEIEVDVNESNIGRVKPGQPVEASLNAYPDWKIPAEVIAIIPTADRNKATVKVRVALKAKDPRIVPEMGARVAFLEAGANPAKASSNQTPALLIPSATIRQEGGQSYVFVYSDGKAERRPVQLGTAVGADRQVLSGVRGGERLVIDPPEGLRDGDRVSVEEGGTR